MSRRLLQLTTVLGALTAIAPMSIDMYLPTLPALARVFATDAGAVQQTLAAFFVGLAVGQLVYGPLVDRVGRKPPLYSGLTLYALASVGCALAPNIGSLIALRLMQALGGCAGAVLARAVVRDLFDAQESARMFSLIMLVMGVAPILAPLAGGALLVLLGWRSIFWALALFGLVVLLGAWAWLPETGVAQRRGSRLPALSSYGRLLADRRFIGFALAGGMTQAGMFAYISGSPAVFIDLYGVPAQHYGWLFGTNALGLIAAAQLNRRLLKRFPARNVLAWALMGTAVFGSTLLIAALTRTGGLPGLLIPLFGYVATLGLVFPNSTALAMGSQPEARAGTASSLLGALQFGVAALASTIVGTTYDGTPTPMATAIAVCGVLGLLADRVLGHATLRPPAGGSLGE